MTLGHRVAVLKDGLLQQCDAPRVAVRAAGEHVRRRLHRLALDEPRARCRSGPTAPCRSAASRCRCRSGPRGAAAGGWTSSWSAFGPSRSSSRRTGSPPRSRSSRSSAPTHSSSAPPSSAARRRGSSRGRTHGAHPRRGERVTLRPIAEEAHLFDPVDRVAAGLLVLSFTRSRGRARRSPGRCIRRARPCRPSRP